MKALEGVAAPGSRARAVYAPLVRKLKTAGRLFRDGGLRSLAGYSFHRYKYTYLRLALRMAPARTPLSRPHIVQLEVSSKCNLRCPSCSLTRETTPARNMVPDEALALLESLPFRPETVSLNGIGEALVNPRFFAIVDLLRERGIDCSFYTNGTLLSERVRREILERDNIVFIGISCDGASKTTFERLRYGARFESWKENVGAFVAAARGREPRPIRVAMNTVVSRDNQHELAGIVELGAELGFPTVQMSDVVPNDETSAAMVLSAAEWAAIDREALMAHAAELGIEASFTSLAKRPAPALNCFQPWEYVQISVEGDVLPCCAIVGSDKAQIMGNLHRESFAEVWQGERFRRFRETAASGTNPICNACPYY